MRDAWLLADWDHAVARPGPRLYVTDTRQGRARIRRNSRYPQCSDKAARASLLLLRHAKVWAINRNVYTIAADTAHGPTVAGLYEAALTGAARPRA